MTYQIHPETTVALSIDGDETVITMREFFADNEEMDANEQALIVATLQASGVCHGGGGAGCEWTLKFIGNLMRMPLADVQKMAGEDGELGDRAGQELVRRRQARAAVMAEVGRINAKAAG